MKIAIPTTDQINIAPRTGRASKFAIYSLLNGTYELIGYRDNPHQHLHNLENKQHNHQDIIDLLKDCDALLVWAVGPQFQKDFSSTNIPIYKTEEGIIKEAINRFSYDMISHKRL